MSHHFRRTEQWLADHSQINAGGAYFLSWGVARAADMTLPWNNVENLPAGNYSLGWDIMTLAPDRMANTRNNFGLKHDIVVRDITQ